MRKVSNIQYRKTQSPSLSSGPAKTRSMSALLQDIQRNLCPKKVFTTQELSILDGNYRDCNIDSHSQHGSPTTKGGGASAVLCAYRTSLTRK